MLWSSTMGGRINIGECIKCGLYPDKNDHDPCLGTLPGLVNACCGHGNDNSAYAQLLDGVCIRGKSALIVLEKLKEVK